MSSDVTSMIINQDTMKEVSISVDSVDDEWFLLDDELDYLQKEMNNNILKYYVDHNRKITYTVHDNNSKLVAKIESL